ncbi:Fc.00g081970.m01.CDS01 [Cosmosporella sp. VM-42]
MEGQQSRKRFTQLDLGPRRNAQTTIKNGQILRHKPAVSLKTSLSTHKPRAGNTFRFLAEPDDNNVLTRESLYARLRSESLWKYYTKSPITALDLGGSVVLARKMAAPEDLVAVRQVPRGRMDQKEVEAFCLLKHHNVMTVLEAFMTDGFFYLVFEEMSLSLDHLVTSPMYPDCRQLGTILGQNLEVTTKDIGDLGMITIQLMQKDDQSGRDRGAVVIKDPERWDTNPHTIEFVSLMTSATSLEQLRKHQFIESMWSRTQGWETYAILDLMLVATFSVRRFYQYESLPPDPGLR